jgi:hypothetical protein
MRANRKGVAGSFVAGAAALLMATALSGVVLAAPAGTCVTGVVPVSFVLPDGSVHPPGEFTACTDRRLSPVQTLQRVSVSDSVHGLFVAKQSPAESDAVRPYLTFRRVRDGEWILVGITLPPETHGNHSLSLRLADRRRVAELVAERSSAGLLAGGAPTDHSEVMLAARLR